MLDKNKTSQIIDAKGIKQTFLAEKLGTSRQNVNKWVNGQADAGRDMEKR